RGVEVIRIGAREELARLLDREGIGVDLVREWCREAGVTVRADLEEPDGIEGGEGWLPELGAGVLEAPVQRVEAVGGIRGTVGEAWLLRRRRHVRQGRDVVRPQEGGAGVGRTVELVHPDGVATG